MKKLKKLIGLVIALAMIVTLTVPSVNVNAETQSEVSVTGFDVVVTGDIYEGSGAFYYESLIDVVLTMSDGTTETYEDFEYLADAYEPASVYVESDMPETGWSVGDTYKATVSWMGFTDTYELQVVENPIKEIAIVVGTPLIEGAQEGIAYEYDEAGNEIEFKCYHPLNYASEIIITETDGSMTSYENDQELYDAYGVWPHIETDQSSTNKWGVGTHTATFEFLGKTYEFDVEVVENPIISIDVMVDGVLYAGAQDGYAEYWPADSEEPISYKEFNLNRIISEYKVTTKDGTEVFQWEDFYDTYGTYVDIVSDQSATNVWGIGTHTFTCSFLGKECKASVEVVENPVKKFSFVVGKPLYEGDVEYAWDVYEAITQFKVTTATGEKVYLNEWTLYDEFGAYPEVEHDLFTDDYQWTVGTHKYTVSFLGVPCEVEVTIVPNPIESIEVVGGVVYEGTQVIYEEPADDNYDEWIQYKAYSEWIAVEKIIVTETSGKKVEYNSINELRDAYKVDGVMLNSDQSSTNVWGLGKHQASFTYLGKTDTFDITVAENPVKSISANVDDILVNCAYTIEKEDGSTIPYYRIWEHFGDITLTFKDGTTETADMETLESKYNCYLDYSDTQWEKPWGVGSHEIEVTFMGAKCKTTVNIVASSKTVTAVTSEKTTEVLNKETTAVVSAILTGSVSEEVVSKETAAKVEEAVNAGKAISTELVVSELTATEVASVLTAAEKTEMIKEAEAALKSENTRLKYIDLSIVLFADENELGTINKLSEEIEITIALPTELKSETGVYKIIRNHDGEIDVLDATNNGDGTITFKTDRFSTYAIAYVDEGADNLSSPDTSDTAAPLGMYVVIITVAIAIYGAMRVKKAIR